MTPDERIEALTMHLEVVTHLHEDFEKKMTEYAADVNKSIKELKDVMTRMANIVISHDERIERLEDSQQ
jgi:AraC-like DNA-binding protein